MMQTSPPSVRAREILDAVARGLPQSDLAPMIRELSRQAEALFESAWQARRGADEAPLASVGESSEFVTDLLQGLADTMPNAPQTQVLSVLNFVERALRIQELAVPPRDPAQVAMHRQCAPIRRGRALLVDDEQAFMRVARTWLQDAGFEVTETTRSDDARRRLDDERWDLLFVDVILPGGGDGFDLAAHALRADIGIAVVFATGYTTRPRPRQLLSWPLLNKPFTRGDFLDALERAMGMAATGSYPP